MQALHLLVPGIEILIITIMLYYLLTFFWNTRGMDLTVTILAFVSLYSAAFLFSLPVLQKFLWSFLNVAALAFLILFQPELRLALSRLSVKGKKYRETSEFDKFLDGISHAIYHLAERRIGALVILENQDSLEEFVNKAVRLDAAFTQELLESIFATTTPLHDGGVIIRETTILSAATILPLADESAQIARSMGTRHRAALGISQITDALAIVVSEETGKVAIARDGIMTRGVKIDRFKGIIRSVFTSSKTAMETGIDILGRFKKWKH
ncbi:MAG: diadenylate cyclase CdaA [Waddliaceae bacterium]